MRWVNAAIKLFKLNKCTKSIYYKKISKTFVVFRFNKNFKKY